MAWKVLGPLSLGVRGSQDRTTFEENTCSRTVGNGEGPRREGHGNGLVNRHRGSNVDDAGLAAAGRWWSRWRLGSGDGFLGAVNICFVFSFKFNFVSFGCSNTECSVL